MTPSDYWFGWIVMGLLGVSIIAAAVATIVHKLDRIIALLENGK